MSFLLAFAVLLCSSTLHTVVSEADDDICTNSTKNDCDPNAKCNRVVADSNPDLCAPKYFCECIEGYTGDGKKGTCEKLPGDAVCVANCDFNKKTLCHWMLGFAFVKRGWMFKFVNGVGYFLETTIAVKTTLINSIYQGNGIYSEFAALAKATPITLTVQLSTQNLQLKLMSNSATTKHFLFLHYNTTQTDWHTVTATIPEGSYHIEIDVFDNKNIQNDDPGYFGIQKVEVAAKC